MKMKLSNEAHVFLIIAIGSFLFFFYSILFPLDVPWKKYYSTGTANVVGVSASVPPNQYNTLAQQLRDKEQTLNAKEQEIIAKEAALQEMMNAERYEDQNKTVLLAIFVGSALFILICVNFYMDLRSRRRYAVYNR